MGRPRELTVIAGEITAAVAGAVLAVGAALIVVGLRRHARSTSMPTQWRSTVQALVVASQPPGRDRGRRRARLLAWCAVGGAVWVATGWPIAGIAVTAGGVWAPWLMGSARVAQERIDRLEALEGWCRRMADTLAGGGAVGLAQAITVSAGHTDETIAGPVTHLAARLRDGSCPPDVAVREFADELDDRVADTVAAAIALALHHQSAGVARVLRQLADGVAHDVRARREIEAARAESRQSIRMLLIIQAGVLVMLALVPSFAAPYTTPVGQVVMACLLAATVWLLVWMRRLALGRRQPRFLGAGAAR
ncbi:type II secretion system F family protein [Pseudonocardia sp. 73-21]|uniref:type II secretion system F family protein n=1 Tax=Pseudonocardia sp. 73-21 TaxID=1895809 RepID=UPI0026222322|nr:type II secretion system F family protein [Pseudonocardia sp. 73-21]